MRASEWSGMGKKWGPLNQPTLSGLSRYTTSSVYPFLSCPWVVYNTDQQRGIVQCGKCGRFYELYELSE
ncbi:unnamed protein product [Penicillium roqueforti FM164]|uniref:Genomic scaffold, ProqFM164S02 n=1 Tax=Penicillium roqueforti (strain FM164) TaxID=1365484 RepID=W6Q599_PENRF|nr:unnamed protein product [Penicillium roqueforti FM164]